MSEKLVETVIVSPKLFKSRRCTCKLASLEKVHMLHDLGHFGKGKVGVHIFKILELTDCFVLFSFPIIEL